MRAWELFLKSQTTTQDILLKGYTDKDKSSLICLFLRHQHLKGLRGKGATASLAGIRLHFARSLQPTGFLDAAVITTARQACRLTPEELRVKRDAGASTSVKLPACEGMLVSMRTRLWEGQEWTGHGLVNRMTYLACMFGFDQSGRVSEYTAAEPKHQDHCTRVDDLTFYVRGNNNVVTSALGSVIARNLHGTPDDSPLIQRIVECRVQAASSKGKVIVKAKAIARRSDEESQFLDHLALWISRSGATGSDELFSIRGPTGRKKALQGRAVRDEIKRTCVLLDLPPQYFSSHSLRKGAITHMRASGATEDDRRDRGNYAPGSQVMNSTYDYATGLGPLAANSLQGGHKPTVADVQRLIPAQRISCSASVQMPPV